MTNPDIFNEPIRDVCTATNAINRTLVNMPARSVGTSAHRDLLEKRDRLDRQRQRLYRRQDAALFAQWAGGPGIAGER